METKVIEGIAGTFTLLLNKEKKEITFLVRDNYPFSSEVVLTLDEEKLNELKNIINEVLNSDIEKRKENEA